MLINSGLDVSPRENDPCAACLVGAAGGGVTCLRNLTYSRW
jgi:hypothetical protein